MPKKIVIISGPTASGKTKYSIDFAEKNDGVIINCDSMQIYQGLPRLSAQPTEDEKRNIKHLLFSYLEPHNNCNVGLWLKLVQEKIQYCFKNNKLPIVVGGTGMYISKLINGISKIPEIPPSIRTEVMTLYNEIGHDNFFNIALKIDKDYTEKLNPNDKQRLMRVLEVYKTTGKSIKYFQENGSVLLYPINTFFHININLPRDLLYERCSLRFMNMVENENITDEIRKFYEKYPDIIKNSQSYSISKTIGLIDGIKYLNGNITLQDFINNSIKITKNYAKRQYTWFNNQFEKFDLVINEVPNSKTFIPIIKSI